MPITTKKSGNPRGGIGNPCNPRRVLLALVFMWFWVKLASFAGA